MWQSYEKKSEMRKKFLSLTQFIRIFNANYLLFSWEKRNFVHKFSKTMTTLYLVRHGETVDNAAQILQGQTPGKLNEKGIEQAEEVAAKMVSNHFDAFVSSDLYRSIETCEVIARPHFPQNTPLEKVVTTTPLLRERDWGDFTGKFIPSLPKDPKDWPDNIETLEKMKSRAQNFLTWLKVTYPDKTVLAVGHGIINKAVQSVYYKRPMNEIQKMTNAEVRILIL